MSYPGPYESLNTPSPPDGCFSPILQQESLITTSERTITLTNSTSGTESMDAMPPDIDKPSHDESFNHLLDISHINSNARSPLGASSAWDRWTPSQLYYGLWRKLFRTDPYMPYPGDSWVIEATVSMSTNENFSSTPSTKTSNHTETELAKTKNIERLKEPKQPSKQTGTTSLHNQGASASQPAQNPTQEPPTLNAQIVVYHHPQLPHQQQQPHQQHHTLNFLPGVIPQATPTNTVACSRSPPNQFVPNNPPRVMLMQQEFHQLTQITTVHSLQNGIDPLPHVTQTINGGNTKSTTEMFERIGQTRQVSQQQQMQKPNSTVKTDFVESNGKQFVRKTQQNGTQQQNSLAGCRIGNRRFSNEITVNGQQLQQQAKAQRQVQQLAKAQHRLQQLAKAQHQLLKRAYVKHLLHQLAKALHQLLQLDNAQHELQQLVYAQHQLQQQENARRSDVHQHQQMQPRSNVHHHQQRYIPIASQNLLNRKKRVQQRNRVERNKVSISSREEGCDHAEFELRQQAIAQRQVQLLAKGQHRLQQLAKAQHQLLIGAYVKYWLQQLDNPLHQLHQLAKSQHELQQLAKAQHQLQQLADAQHELQQLVYAQHQLQQQESARRSDVHQHQQMQPRSNVHHHQQRYNPIASQYLLNRKKRVQQRKRVQQYMVSISSREKRYAMLSSLLGGPPLVTGAPQEQQQQDMFNPTRAANGVQEELVA